MAIGRFGRRGFLLGAAGATKALPPQRGEMPSIRLGKHSVTRLIAGANPINGYGHSTPRMSELMVRYFTVERTTEFLVNCERQGINTWQSSYSPKVRDALNAARERGAKPHFICLTSGKQEDMLKDILALRPIAIVHHGGVTDSLFQAGQHQAVHDYVKKVHDLGILAGVSTHNPDHLAYVEDAGWENDLYMTCFYNVTRTREQIRSMLGDDLLEEMFLADDPKRMTARIRQVKKPCLAFKILAAGRISGSPASVERAFTFAYQNIKLSDAAIVGMFPILHDEVAEDAALARKYAQPT